MLPFSKRKLFEQIIIGTGLVLAFVRCYANWKVRNRHYTVFDLVLSIFTVTVIITGIVTLLLFLIHQIERKWKNLLSKEGGNHHWQIRPSADCGIILLPIFPLALLVGLINYWAETSHTYSVVTVLSQGFMFTSMAYLWRTGDESDSSLQTLATVAAISSIKIFLILWHLRLLGLVASCTMALSSQVLFLLLLHNLLRKCPKTFSIGEALMVSQATISLTIASLLWLFYKVFSICGPLKLCSLGFLTTQLVYVLYLGVSSLILLCLVYTKPLKHPLPFYGVCGLIGLLFLYPTWFWILRKEPLQWLFQITFNKSLPRSLLVLHWLACTVLSVAVVAWANLRGIRITTNVRKLFHGVVILIYFPGLFWDTEFLFFATSLAFTLFIGVECIRVLQMPPFGETINSALSPFLDEKDAGLLILTHIYLLVGCSISLWMLPVNFENYGFHISLAAGILALGFGDTAASIGGVMFGKHKLPDTRKTVEGTLSAFVVQTAASFVLLLIVSDKFTSTEFFANCVYLILATSVSCLLEGVTKQIDNLLLPVFLYMMLVVI